MSGILFGRYVVLELDSIKVRYREKKRIKSLIIHLGGVISYVVTKKCSYIIVNDEEKATSSYKCRIAAKYRIPVVSLDFLWECERQQRLVNCDEFLLLGKTKSQMLGCGRITVPSVPATQVNPSINVNLKDIPEIEYGSQDDPWPVVGHTYAVTTFSLFLDAPANKFAVHEIHSLDEPRADINMFRVFSHTGFINKNMKVTGTRTCRYCPTVPHSVGVYGTLCEQTKYMAKQNMTYIQGIGSPNLQLRQSDIAGRLTTLSPEVELFVDLIWREAIGRIETEVTVDPSTITLDQIERAEGILLQLKDVIKSRMENCDEQTKQLSQEFYGCVPCSKDSVMTNMKSVSMKKDLCQLLRDMLMVNESTNWSHESGVRAKYTALGCSIRHVPRSDLEYEKVITHLNSTEEVIIHNIYSVTRYAEAHNFNPGNLGNIDLMFHSSRPQNFVGLLSRGLLLPKIVVEDFGGDRTDVGSLGYGIYFGDSLATSAQYAHRSRSGGARLVLVCAVARGNVYEAVKRDAELTQPHVGYDSMRAVGTSPQQQTDFKDNEYVIYNTSQQKIEYIVEFSLVSDGPIETIERPLDQTSFSEAELVISDTNIAIDDVTKIESPLFKVQPGLIGAGDAPVPLKAVHIRAQLMDLAAQVVVLQYYTNDTNAAIEAKFVFPLDDMAAVCGFEAFIDDKHIVGEVKERDAARRQYRRAVDEGHGAYLMDQDAETPEVFTVNVGNLPAKSSALIKITYVTELQMEASLISFRLLATVAPWKHASASQDQTQDAVATVGIAQDSQRETTLMVSAEMPFEIVTISSPSHKILKKVTATKAVVSLGKNQTLDNGFHLLIGLAEVHVPRMWVETDDQNPDHQACMLTFYPEFDLDNLSKRQFEVIFLVDQSNSMKDQPMRDAVKLLSLLLHLLPDKTRFNIVVFGTAYDELFPLCRPKTRNSLKSASEFIKKQRVYLGGSDVYRPLYSVYSLSRDAPVMRNVILISDGHISNQDLVASAVRNNAESCRLFALAVSDSANRHFLRTLAKLGGGAFEFFDSKVKSQWEEKASDILTKVQQPSLSSVSIEWQEFDASGIQQAPKRIMSLFHGARQVVYGFVPNCNMATLKAKVGGQEVSTTVYCSPLSMTQGRIVHRLTAKALITDWEEGILGDDRAEHEAAKAKGKKDVINISKQYSIVTRFTSFVAIEERNKDSLPELSQKEVARLFAGVISQEDVDCLPFMTWDGEVLDDAAEKMEKEISTEHRSSSRSPQSWDDESEEEMEINDDGDEDGEDEYMCMGLFDDEGSSERFLYRPAVCETSSTTREVIVDDGQPHVAEHLQMALPSSPSLPRSSPFYSPTEGSSAEHDQTAGLQYSFSPQYSQFDHQTGTPVQEIMYESQYSSERDQQDMLGGAVLLPDPVSRTSPSSATAPGSTFFSYRRSEQPVDQAMGSSYRLAPKIAAAAPSLDRSRPDLDRFGAVPAIADQQQSQCYFGVQAPGIGAQAPSFGAQVSSFRAQAPSFGPQAPSFGAQAPSFGPEAPSFGAQALSFGPQAPSFGAQAPGFGPQAPRFGAQISSFGAQALSFGAQVSSFAAPDLSFAAPVANFRTPVAGFGAQVTNFGAPDKDKSAKRKADMSLEVNLAEFDLQSAKHYQPPLAPLPQAVAFTKPPPPPLLAQPPPPPPLFAPPTPPLAAPSTFLSQTQPRERLEQAQQPAPTAPQSAPRTMPEMGRMMEKIAPQLSLQIESSDDPCSTTNTKSDAFLCSTDNFSALRMKRKVFKSKARGTGDILLKDARAGKKKKVHGSPAREDQDDDDISEVTSESLRFSDDEPEEIEDAFAWNLLEEYEGGLMEEDGRGLIVEDQIPLVVEDEVRVMDKQRIPDGDEEGSIGECLESADWEITEQLEEVYQETDDHLWQMTHKSSEDAKEAPEKVDVTHLGIGVNLSRIMTAQQVLSFSGLKLVMSSQSAEGYWDLDDEICGLLGINREKLTRILSDAGLSSLGSTIRNEVERMIATLLVVFFVSCFLSPESFPLSISRMVNVTYPDISDVFIEKNLQRGVQYAVGIIRKFPLMASRLELGQTWLHVFTQLLGPEFINVVSN